MPDLPTPHSKSFVASLAKAKFPKLGKSKDFVTDFEPGKFQDLEINCFENSGRMVVEFYEVRFSQFSVYFGKDDGGYAFLTRLMWI